MIYPKTSDCPPVPEGRDIWEYLGVTEIEYVEQKMGFRPKTARLEQRTKKPFFFSFFPYSIKE